MISAWRRSSIPMLFGFLAVLLGTLALSAPQAYAHPAARPAKEIPASLAQAIHARLGPGPIGLGADPTWITTSTPSAALTRSAGTSGDSLGYSVALSADGTTALVGAPFVNSDTGAAYIFHVSSEHSWTSKSAPKAILVNSGGAAQDRFGYSVALSADGRTALIGAPGVNSDTGAAYIFHVSSEHAWTTTTAPAATLAYSGGTAQDTLGTSVALSADGSTALAGAPGASSSAGAAYIFHAPAERSWTTTSTPAATLTDAGAGAQEFGGAVALSTDGTTALIGADFAGPGFETGAAYIFRAAAERSWTTTSTPAATLTNASGPSEQATGNAVALSSDGTTALVGAFGAGAAYVFHAPAESSWTSMSHPVATLTVGGPSASDAAGWSVALSAAGTTALTGTYFANKLAGAAYIFQAPSEATWSSSSAPTATLTYAGATKNYRVGFSVAFPADASIALIGSPGRKSFKGAGFIYSAGS